MRFRVRVRVRVRTFEQQSDSHPRRDAREIGEALIHMKESIMGFKFRNIHSA